jgi:hypothetical protein
MFCLTAYLARCRQQGGFGTKFRTVEKVCDMQRSVEKCYTLLSTFEGVLRGNDLLGGCFLRLSQKHIFWRVNSCLHFPTTLLLTYVRESGKTTRPENAAHVTKNRSQMTYGGFRLPNAPDVVGELGSSFFNFSRAIALFSHPQRMGTRLCGVVGGRKQNVRELPCSEFNMPT